MNLEVNIKGSRELFKFQICTMSMIKGWETGNHDKIERDKVFRYVLLIDEGFWKVSRCKYLRHDEMMTLTQKMSRGWTNHRPGMRCIDQWEIRVSVMTWPTPGVTSLASSVKIKTSLAHERVREPAVIACSTFITLCSIHAAVTQGDKRSMQQH